MPTLTVESEVTFDASCTACGTQLYWDEKRTARSPAIEVNPCPECLQNEYERGKDNADVG